LRGYTTPFYTTHCAEMVKGEGEVREEEALLKEHLSNLNSRADAQAAALCDHVTSVTMASRLQHHDAIASSQRGTVRGHVRTFVGLDDCGLSSADVSTAPLAVLPRCGRVVVLCCSFRAEPTEHSDWCARKITSGSQALLQENAQAIALRPIPPLRTVAVFNAADIDAARAQLPPDVFLVDGYTPRVSRAATSHTSPEWSSTAGDSTQRSLMSRSGATSPHMSLLGGCQNGALLHGPPFHSVPNLLDATPRAASVDTSRGEGAVQRPTSEPQPRMSGRGGTATLASPSSTNRTMMPQAPLQPTSSIPMAHSGGKGARSVPTPPGSCSSTSGVVAQDISLWSGQAGRVDLSAWQQETPEPKSGIPSPLPCASNVAYNCMITSPERGTARSSSSLPKRNALSRPL
jgi:hypothetical protein